MNFAVYNSARSQALIITKYFLAFCRENSVIFCSLTKNYLEWIPRENNCKTKQSKNLAWFLYIDSECS